MLALLTLTLLGPTFYSPAEAQSLFEQGNAAYAREDFPAARESFQKLLDHGYGGPDVLFNLGTTRLAEGALGEAVLQLERARREGGAQPDVEANLAVARGRQADRVVGQMEEGLALRVAHATQDDQAGVLLLVLWGLGFGLLILRGLSTRFRTTWSGILAGICLALCVVPGAVLAAHAVAREGPPEAVVVAKTLPALEAPLRGSKVAFEVHEGLKVRVLDEAGSYVHLRLPNGLEGWAERAGVVNI